MCPENHTVPPAIRRGHGCSSRWRASVSWAFPFGATCSPARRLRSKYLPWLTIGLIVVGILYMLYLQAAHPEALERAPALLEGAEIEAEEQALCPAATALVWSERLARSPAGRPWPRRKGALLTSTVRCSRCDHRWSRRGGNAVMVGEISSAGTPAPDAAS